MGGDSPAGAAGLDGSPVTLSFTSFEEPLVSSTPVFTDSAAQNSDHELTASAPTCTGAPASFLPLGSCTGTATDGMDCATRFAALCAFTPGDAASCACTHSTDGQGVETCATGAAATDCTGGAGDGCVFALDCAARFALQPGTTETDCTSAAGAGCTYSLHNPVSYAPCSSGEAAAELGFRSFYEDAFGASSGNSSAQGVGVVADSSSGSGQQVFEIYDVDGFAYGMLDVVPVSGYSAVHLSCYVYFSASTWETEDYAKVWVSAEAGGPADVVVMHTTGDNIDAGVENQWTEVTGSLGGLKTAT